MGNIVKFGNAPVWVEGDIELRQGDYNQWISDVYEEAPLGLTQWVGAFTVLDGSGGLEIGEYTVISPGVHIYSHVNDLPLKGADRPVTRRSTKIGSHVYLGPNVVVCAGVTVGDGAVVGAGAYIDEDVPEGVKVIPMTKNKTIVDVSRSDFDSWPNPQGIKVGDAVEVHNQGGGWARHRVETLKIIHDLPCAVFKDGSYIGLTGDGIKKITEKEDD